jgi:hypothetical protein
VKRIAVKIQEVRDVCEDRKEKATLKYDNRHWFGNNDARITSFRKIINVCNSALLTFEVGNQTVARKDWWEDMTDGEISREDIIIYAREYESFLKVSFIQSFYSCVESSLRLILRGIDREACSRGTDAFKNIYECLLRSKLSGNFDRYVSLLDLYRELRNTIHNNGVYFHRRWESKVVEYEGNEYEFKIGEPIDFADWNFIRNASVECVELLYNVVKNPVVSDVEKNIADPFAQNTDSTSDSTQRGS